MEKAIIELRTTCLKAKEASCKLAFLPTGIKNEALSNIAADIMASKDEILAANKIDRTEAENSGMNDAMQDRLLLTEERLKSIATDVLAVAALPDPVGEIIDMRTMANGLIIGRKRVPLGVIGSIYESRPNVTIDISTLCLKAGNAVVLRGGKEAFNSNRTLAKVVQEALRRTGIPQGAVQFIDNTDRALVNHLLKMNDVIDLMIPRGGASLIKFIKENATMPVVAGGIGVCHTYIDKFADLDKAVAIAFNAKTQRPTVCNAMDCLLVHTDIAEEYLPRICFVYEKAGVEMRCGERALTILKNSPSLKVIAATNEDWGTEFLSLKAAIRVVDSLDGALEHIARYGSGHSEAIVTEDYSTAMRFLNEADAAAVFVNASTRFTDGAQFGLGAELGISTQKMHARGPLGLKEITSYKWIIFGSGQVRH
jgi:glutamate-5-semialdehyde dehydrogenase